jgi:uncharacterized membrane protein
MTALLSTLISVILPVILSYLSDKMGNNVELHKGKRDDLRALHKAKSSVQVASTWKHHDLDIERLLLKAKTRK